MSGRSLVSTGRAIGRYPAFNHHHLEDPAQASATVIVGEGSNLSRQLADRLPEVTMLSARRLIQDSALPRLPDSPFRLVINCFQPATKLSDVSDPVGYVDLSIAATARLLAALPGTACTLSLIHI